MRKKCFISALFMLVFCVSQSALADTYDFEIGRYQYKINDDRLLLVLLVLLLELALPMLHQNPPIKYIK